MILVDQTSIIGSEIGLIFNHLMFGIALARYNLMWLNIGQPHDQIDQLGYNLMWANIGQPHDQIDELGR